MSSTLAGLLDRLAHIADLSSAANLLEWDQETYMPTGAAEARARQISTLREMAHSMLLADETEAALLHAEADPSLSDDLEFGAPLVRILRRDIERNRRVPSSLVAELAGASARAKEAWRAAREADDFNRFAPHLEHILELLLQKAEALGFDDHPYDALLDEYEPGMRSATVMRVFAELRDELVPIVDSIAAADEIDNSFLHAPFDPQKQWVFGVDAIRDIGYDFDRGRIDVSAHPFSTSFSISDCRITTRVREDNFPTAFFGTLHEAGHALYEQGIHPRFERTPLADGTSLGIHESQSRLWENQIGRSRAYWNRNFSKLQKTFPDALAGVDSDAFYRAINKVEPSLIRVEADEVTYNLHIMLRFDIEMALVSGDLRVVDIPDAWNELMDRYLGIRPARVSEGALQDIHWSLGAIGYFPTYTLGTIISAQLHAAAERDLGSIGDLIEGGQFETLLNWLRTNVHQWGRARSTGEILRKTTGNGLDATPWLDYVRAKHGGIYGI